MMAGFGDPHMQTVDASGLRLGIVGARWHADLIDHMIERAKSEVPHVCYHPQLGPIQTCDTCMVEINGELVRACATTVSTGMEVTTKSARADAARREAFDRILGNHMLYCTVCDNNNENCTVHNTALALKVEHQDHPFKPKPYDVDMSNPLSPVTKPFEIDVTCP